MQLSEKAAYVKGLIEGLELDPKDKQTRVFKVIADLLCEMAEEIKDLGQCYDDVCDRLHISARIHLQRALSNVLTAVRFLSLAMLMTSLTTQMMSLKPRNNILKKRRILSFVRILRNCY